MKKISKPSILDNRYIRMICSSFLSGLIMALAALELVAAKSFDKFFIGGFIQGFGLLAVLYLNLDLFNVRFIRIFTEKEKLKTLLDLFIILIVNLLTVITVAVICYVMVKGNESMVKAAKDIANLRVITIGGTLGKDWYDVLIASIMCGLIVSTACKIFFKLNNTFAKILTIVLAVGLYVVCGFEQIMTNTFYVVFAWMVSPSTILDLAIVLVGNLLGATIIYFLFKVIDRPKVK